MVTVEANSGAHHWARKPRVMGLDASIISAQLVSPYRLEGHTGKNHGSYQFEELRQVFINSQITLTHAHLARMLKGVIKLLRSRLRAASTLPDPDGWRTQRGKAIMPVAL